MNREILKKQEDMMGFKWIYVPVGRSYMIDEEKGIILISNPLSPGMPCELELIMNEKK